ncbi:MAG TPA: Fe-S cluster assembly protein SufD [Thermoanaerobaculaceae bacterium]|nr:Fe-S cluster assembly protein SufD [Thermoanaerobaculaceae bacterium]
MASRTAHAAAPPALALDHVEEASRAAGEDAALLALRNQARVLLSPLDLPDRARHLWRYTDPSRFLPESDPTALAPTDVGPPWRLDEPLSVAALLAGGALRVVEVDPKARKAGVTVEDLHRATVGGHLGSIVPPSHGFLEAINTAAWRGGVLVRVPDGVELQHPIRLRLVAGIPTIPRVVVLAGRGSSFEIIEGHVGGERGAGKVIGVTEIVVGEGASVRYGLVQRWETGVVGHLTARARVHSGARFQMSLASFGGTVFKADVGAILAGEGAEVETCGVAMGGDSQHFDHHTEHVHESGKTHSNLDFKVALTGSARSAYTGMIRIAPGAAGAEAYQENRNLLLSENARAESIPELEILTDDVRCSHGATVSPVDPEQLFYLKSRGLPHLQAMRVIVYGFLDQTLARLPQTTRDRIAALVAARLHSD